MLLSKLMMYDRWYR